MTTTEETSQSGFYQEDGNSHGYILMEKLQGWPLSKRVIMVKIYWGLRYTYEQHNTCGLVLILKRWHAN